MENSGKKHPDLESWVHSIDREVSSLVRSNTQLRTMVEGQTTQLSHIESSIDSIRDQTANSTKPQMYVAVGVIGIVVTVFTVLIELRLAPSEMLAEATYEAIQRQTELSAEFIRADTAAEKDRESINRQLLERRSEEKVLVKRLNTLENKVSRNEGRYEEEWKEIH